MTKTLTEQWRDGTLPEGWYYVVIEWDDEIRMLYFEGDYFLDTDVPLNNDNIKEVLAPVPSYDHFSQLVKKVERLQKRLEIATKALKEYADSSNWYETDDFGISAVDQFACDDYGYNIAKEALEEMEGVK